MQFIVTWVIRLMAYTHYSNKYNKGKNIVKQEIIIPAIDKVLPEPFIDFDLLSPIQLK